MLPEDLVEQVLGLVERVPPGRATTYGTIADHLGRCGPRRIGRVMAQHGSAVPWWRVVRADGSLPAALAPAARSSYDVEGTPLRPSGAVDLLRAYWAPGASG